MAASSLCHLRVMAFYSGYNTEQATATKVGNWVEEQALRDVTGTSRSVARRRSLGVAAAVRGSVRPGSRRSRIEPRPTICRRRLWRPRAHRLSRGAATTGGWTRASS